MRNKKGMTVIEIIIAMAILLIVAFVLLAVFTGKVKIFSKSTDCAGLGGDCLRGGSCASSYPNKPVQIMAKGCPLGTNDVGPCCIPAE